jgi:hypothetical protein
MAKKKVFPKINVNKGGCSSVSSNCIIWSGPDLKCINLCKGDSITEVVYEMAMVLCNIMEELDVTDYDLSCLIGDKCPPNSLKEVIELLSKKICSLDVSGIDVNDYELGCLIEDKNNRPKNLKDLIELLVEYVCNLESVVCDLNVTFSNTTDIDTLANCDGVSAKATVTGGSGLYSYEWSFLPFFTVAGTVFSPTSVTVTGQGTDTFIVQGEYISPFDEGTPMPFDIQPPLITQMYLRVRDLQTGCETFRVINVSGNIC